VLWDAKNELNIKAVKVGLERWDWQLRDQDASSKAPRFEPSQSDQDASGRFSSNGPSSYGSNEMSLFNRTVLKHPNHDDYARAREDTDDEDDEPSDDRQPELLDVVYADALEVAE